MSTPKAIGLLFVAITSLCTSTTVSGQSSSESDGSAPRIRPVDQRFLTQLVRRTIDQELEGQPRYEPDYRPPALADLQCQVAVIVRDHGYLRGIGVSDRAAVIPAAVQAARRALDSSQMKREGLTRVPDGVRYEVQAMGPPLAYAGSASWEDPGVLERFVDPGAEGVSIFLDGEQHWFTPGEMIAKNLTLRTALHALAKEVTLDPTTLREGKLSKFRTLHWWEYGPNGEIVTLHRGMTLVPQSAVTTAGLDDAVDRIGRYLLFRQKRDGRLANTYSPAADGYSNEDCEADQSGAAWALAQHARRHETGPVNEAFDRLLRERRKHLFELPNLPAASFVGEPDGRNRLATTAQFCLALATAPDAERHADLRRRLMAAMLWLQLPSGKFVTAFPPAKILDTQDVMPGQALLALAHCFELEPTEEVATAFVKAFGFYRPYFERTGSPGMIPWHMQAFARMARLTKRRDYADFVFAMADAVCAHQLGSGAGAPPELCGAVVASGLPAGDTTAAYVAGLVDAAVLAGSLGETDRAARYRVAALHGTRFVLQLQVRPEECYYIRSPRDAVDGIRNTPITSQLRIESCQHALLALHKVRTELLSD